MQFTSLKQFSQIIYEQCRSYLTGIKILATLVSSLSPAPHLPAITLNVLQFITICLGIVLSTIFRQLGHNIIAC